MKPKLNMKVPENKFRLFFYNFTQNKKFEYFILGTIIFNSLTLCIKWPNMNEKLQNSLDAI